jgi:hypothetical protein
MEYIKARLTETTTWLGFASVCAGSVIFFDEPNHKAILGTIAVLCGFMGVFFKDKK